MMPMDVIRLKNIKEYEMEISSHRFPNLIIELFAIHRL